MQTHSQTHTQRAWLLNTRGLTRYSSAMCSEYCCIPSTQYAQHIALLISLTLSLSVFLVCPRSLSTSLPPSCSPPSVTRTSFPQHPFLQTLLPTLIPQCHLFPFDSSTLPGSHHQMHLYCCFIAFTPFVFT